MSNRISQFFLQLLFITHITLLHTRIVVAHPNPLQKRGISQELFDDLDTFMKYASSAYTLECPSPLGNTLVASISDAATSTQGFIARDDVNKLLIIAFRGSQEIEDVLTVAGLSLVPFTSQNVVAPGAEVHSGFLTAYNSVASLVITTVQNQLAGPAAGYNLRTTGHSLGGSLSSIAAISLKFNFPDVPIQMYTYGQPRTGNPAYASLVNNMFGTDVFRNVHTSDGVPTLIPEILGYRHHAFEHFQSPDPASPQTVKVCDASGEDPTCSDSIPSTGINPAHLLYFGRLWDTAFCS